MNPYHPAGYDEPTKPTSEEGRRQFFADITRVSGTFLIVQMHIACCPCVYDFSNSLEWWTANFYDSLARPGVPLFIMISGMLLLDPDKTESLGAFFRKRINKVVTPFLAWQFVYLLIFSNKPFSWLGTISSILSKPSYPHFWFIFSLIPLYLATPILRVYSRHADKSNQLYFVGLWFSTVSLLPVVDYFFGFRLGFQSQLAVATGFVGYFILGHLLRDVCLNKRPIQAFLALALALLVIFTACGTYALTWPNGKMNEFFFQFLTPNVIGMSICIWLLLKSIPWETFDVPITRKLVAWVSLRSYSIFLVHFLVWYPFQQKGLLGLRIGSWLGMNLDCTIFHPVIGIPLTTCAVIILSLVALSILRMVPGIRRFLP